MDFFEKLRERTMESGRSYVMGQGALVPGINYTVNTLKEMMAGEAIFINDVNEHDALYPFFGEQVWLIAIKYDEEK